jgi:hypothetical protein
MLSNVKVDIVGLLIGLRHLGTDLIIHYRSLRAIPPRMWGNMNYLRWHKQSDNIDKYKQRLDDYALFKIGERISERMYLKNERYYFWIDKLRGKLIGVDELVFEQACLEYLAITPGALNAQNRLMKIQPNDGEGEKKNATKAFIEMKKKEYL